MQPVSARRCPVGADGGGPAAVDAVDTVAMVTDAEANRRSSRHAAVDSDDAVKMERLQILNGKLARDGSK